MTKEELDSEWFLTYETRIAILAGREEPARWMVDMAKKEADDLVKTITLSLT